ncbi:hypothetical protein LZ31DRAFT_94812 [Colletotrichum somersetense]|nr:hypothetical protein LZ31DRAFT_94812 [Colletotrichum somersetense]
MIPTSAISPTQLPQDGTVRKLPSLPGERTHHTPRTLDQLVSLVNVHRSSLSYLTPYHTYLPTLPWATRSHGRSHRLTPLHSAALQPCLSTSACLSANPKRHSAFGLFQHYRYRYRPSVLLRTVSTSTTTRPCLDPSLPASPPPFPHNLTPPTASSLPPHRVPLHYTQRPSVGARFCTEASTP